MIVRFPNWFPQFGKRLSVLLVASSTGFKLLRAFPSRSHSQRCKIPDIHFPPSIFAPRCQNQNIFTFLVFDCICNWMDPFQSLSISGGRQEHVDLSQEGGREVTLLWCTSCGIAFASNLCHKCYLLTLFHHRLHLVPFFSISFFKSIVRSKNVLCVSS